MSVKSTLELSAGLIIAFALLGCSEPTPEGEGAPTPSASGEPPTSSQADGLKAYAKVYRVLTHPRCMNCHPDGDRPLQFEDARDHAMNVQRGPKDRGRAGQRCTTCHQQANQDLPRLPPGSPVWRLAPREQAFQGRSPRALALQLNDPQQSHMTLDELITHVRDDALVGWGWKPGPGRAPIRTPRDEFVAAFTTWVAAGAPVPEEQSK
jgi:phytoene dehydrogenase-like protein